MKSQVALTINRGELQSERLVFYDPTVITVGRAPQCDIRVPNHDDYMEVSRRHCWFEIDPPLLRVCDGGSMNGTYVNGRVLGERGEARRSSAPIHETDLFDGDEVRIGRVAIRVETTVSVADTEVVSPVPGFVSCNSHPSLAFPVS